MCVFVPESRSGSPHFRPRRRSVPMNEAGEAGEEEEEGRVHSSPRCSFYNGSQNTNAAAPNVSQTKAACLAGTCCEVRATRGSEAACQLMDELRPHFQHHHHTAWTCEPSPIYFSSCGRRVEGVAESNVEFCAECVLAFLQRIMCLWPFTTSSIT